MGGRAEEACIEGKRAGPLQRSIELSIRKAAPRSKKSHIKRLAALVSAFTESAVRPKFQVALMEINAAITMVARRRPEQQMRIPLALNLSVTNVPRTEILDCLRLIGEMVRTVRQRAKSSAAVSRAGNDKWRYEFLFALTSADLDLNKK